MDLIKKLGEGVMQVNKLIDRIDITKETKSLEEMKAAIILDKGSGFFVGDYSLDKLEDGSFELRVALKKENLQPKEFQGRFEYKSYRASSANLQTALDLIKEIGA